MNLVSRFFIGYLILSGLAAHALLVVMVALRPDVTNRAEISIENWLGLHWPDVFANDAQRAAKTPVVLSEVVVPWRADPSRFQTPPGKARISGRIFDSLLTAAKALTDGETLYIGAGTYTQPMILTANRIKIIGDGHVHIQNTEAQGKAAMVVRGHEVEINNIECSHVEVSDGNGACVRFEGQDLNLDHVYFHDAQQGLLTGPNPAEVKIQNSWFVRLGHGGQAHGIYVGGGNLEIFRSIFLASRDQGHEIKSRARSTQINTCVIASLDGEDSRLIDVSNGGRLNIENSVLEQGPFSSNHDLIGYGLESGKEHDINSVVITGNTIIMERLNTNQLLHLGIVPDSLTVSNNEVINADRTDQYNNNQYFTDRKDAGLQAYPLLGR